MVININTNSKDFYKEYYSILNYVFKLSNKELAILSEFSFLKANLPEDLSPEQKNIKTFDSIARKKVAQILGISIQNLNNYIKILKFKKFLIPFKYNNVNKIKFNPNVFIDLKDLLNVQVNYKINL
jgi:hypothetical protein